MPEQELISLSDSAMDLVMRLTTPLVPDDRVALVNALAALLRSEPQPPGDGAVFRHVRTLLSTGHYKRSDAFAVGGGAARATGQSALCNASPIRRSRTSPGPPPGAH
jgi:hypothetical protein